MELPGFHVRPQIQLERPRVARLGVQVPVVLGAVIVAAAPACLGRRYDLRNLFDLGRYLLPLPHLPVHWRRRALALGSGDPSRAICSTLIAELFQSLRYPILPILGTEDMDDTARDRHRREVLHIRDHRLYAPRDFDISPYFEIVKPALQQHFDYHRLARGAGQP